MAVQAMMGAEANMSLIEQLETRTRAFKPAELAMLLNVTQQHIYKMAASGKIHHYGSQRLCVSILTRSPDGYEARPSGAARN
jgi:predicted XRE-type DNA-binding protein